MLVQVAECPFLRQEFEYGAVGLRRRNVDENRFDGNFIPLLGFFGAAHFERQSANRRLGRNRGFLRHVLGQNEFARRPLSVQPDQMPGPVIANHSRLGQFDSGKFFESLGIQRFHALGHEADLVALVD